MSFTSADLVAFVKSLDAAPSPVGICAECGRWYFSHPDHPDDPRAVLAHAHDIMDYGIHVEERYAGTLKRLRGRPAWSPA